MYCHRHFFRWMNFSFNLHICPNWARRSTCNQLLFYLQLISTAYDHLSIGGQLQRGCSCSWSGCPGIPGESGPTLARANQLTAEYLSPAGDCALLCQDNPRHVRWDSGQGSWLARATTWCPDSPWIPGQLQHGVEARCRVAGCSVLGDRLCILQQNAHADRGKLTWSDWAGREAAHSIHLFRSLPRPPRNCLHLVLWESPHHHIIVL